VLPKQPPTRHFWCPSCKRVLQAGETTILDGIRICETVFITERFAGPRWRKRTCNTPVKPCPKNATAIDILATLGD
jgi:hypothetical protein